MNDKQYTQQRQSATVKRCVRCPIHRAVIGKYDPRVGLINATFLCPKCRTEYTYTIPPRKP